MEATPAKIISIVHIGLGTMLKLSSLLSFFFKAFVPILIKALIMVVLPDNFP
jgi:hypothetical protein